MAKPTQKDAINKALTDTLLTSKELGNYPGGRTGRKNPNFVEVSTGMMSKAFVDDTKGRKVATKNPSKTKYKRTF